MWFNEELKVESKKLANATLLNRMIAKLHFVELCETTSCYLTVKIRYETILCKTTLCYFVAK